MPVINISLFDKSRISGLQQQYIMLRNALLINNHTCLRNGFIHFQAKQQQIFYTGIDWFFKFIYFRHSVISGKILVRITYIKLKTIFSCIQFYTSIIQELLTLSCIIKVASAASIPSNCLVPFLLEIRISLCQQLPTSSESKFILATYH